jgi:hypothetical protein
MSGLGMHGFARVVLLSAFPVCCLLALGCGGGMNTTMDSNRVLLSMSISPSAVDAQKFMNGQVMFAATGTFSQPPSPAIVTFMAPYSGSWAVSNPNIATIDQNGMAQCISGQSGTVTVSAIASTNAATGTGATSTAVSATATLICP